MAGGVKREMSSPHAASESTSGHVEMPSPWSQIAPVEKSSWREAESFLRKEFKALEKQRRYGFSPIREIPDAGSFPPTDVKEGYTGDIKKLDVSLPHTLDVKNFIDLEVSIPLAEIMKGNGKIELHRAGVKDCLSSLRKRGYDKYFDIKTPWGPPMFMAVKSDSDDYKFAMANIYGSDFLEHYQAMFKFLNVRESQIQTYRYDYDFQSMLERQVSESGVKPETVMIGGLLIAKYLERRLGLADKHKHLNRHADNLRRPGEGETPANRVLLRSMKERRQAAADLPPKRRGRVKKQYERVIAGLKPLLDSEDADRVFSMSSNELLRDGGACEIMYDIAGRMDKLKQGNPRVIELPNQDGGFDPELKSQTKKSFPREGSGYVKYVGEDPLHMAVMQYRDSDGETREILFTEFPYGNLSRDAAKAFLKVPGLKRMLFFGSAGSIRGVDDEHDHIHVGDIGLPMDIFGKDGRHLNPKVENRILDFMEDVVKKEIDDSVKVVGDGHEIKTAYDPANPRFIPTSHKLVKTPFLETRPLIDSWKRGFYDSVDCEIGYVVQAIEEHDGIKPEFGAIAYMEDIIGLPGLTLGEIDRRKTLAATRTRIVDTLIGGPRGNPQGGYLDIQEFLPANE